MKKLITPLVVVLILLTKTAFSQCETWLNSPEKEEIENSYVIYKDYLKNGAYDKALSHWEIVYENAPAADGKRSSVYSDGRILLMEKFNAEKKKKGKKELADFIFRLIEEEKKCYPKNEIVPPPKKVLKFRSAIK